MTSDPAPEFELFRSLCRILGGRGVDATGTRESDPDWPRLVDMAESLDLLPALAVRCQQIDLRTVDLGAQRERLLEQALMANTQRNMTICAQAIKLARCLNKASITPLFLKGTAGLLLGEDEHIGSRRQIDIDLIVPPEETRVAGDTLRADGYRFCEFPDAVTAVPLRPGDTGSAIRASSAHHHLPPLVKEGYAATVELHTHFLPSRFQRNNPLNPLFARAQVVESHGVRFRVAAREHQLIHLVLGKFVHDGYRSRRTFPIREGCDLIGVLERGGSAIDHGEVRRHCGPAYPLFLGLACELLDHGPHPCAAGPAGIEPYLGLLEKRFASPATGILLDAWARADHLAHQLAYSPFKLPAYLRRHWPSRTAEFGRTS